MTGSPDEPAVVPIGTPGRVGSGSALDDAWRRMHWANGYGKELYNRLMVFQESQPYLVRVDRHGDWGETIFRRMIDPTAEAEWFDEFARYIGTFLDHVRAAMNYAAYQLALRVVEDDPASNLNPATVEFPIFNTKDEFANKHWVKKFPQEHRDFFDSVQPRDGRNPSLWVLHELARKYRHRLVHPVAMWPFAEHHGILVNDQTVEIELYDHGRPLQDE